MPAIFSISNLGWRILTLPVGRAGRAAPARGTSLTSGPGTNATNGTSEGRVSFRHRLTLLASAHGVAACSAQPYQNGGSVHMHHPHRGRPQAPPWQKTGKRLSNQQMRLIKLLCLSLAVILGTAGCGTFVAEQLTQAPKAYPTWFAPKARVMLGYSPKFLTSFPTNFVEVGPPEARLCYRVVLPADYHLQVASWVKPALRAVYQANLTSPSTAKLPAPANRWTARSRAAPWFCCTVMPSRNFPWLRGLCALRRTAGAASSWTCAAMGNPPVAAFITASTKPMTSASSSTNSTAMASSPAPLPSWVNPTAPRSPCVGKPKYRACESSMAIAPYSRPLQRRAQPRPRLRAVGAEIHHQVRLEKVARRPRRQTRRPRSRHDHDPITHHRPFRRRGRRPNHAPR